VIWDAKLVEAVTGLKVVWIVPDGLSKHMQTQSPLTEKVTTFMAAANMPNYKMVGEPGDNKLSTCHTCRLSCQEANYYHLITKLMKLYNHKGARNAHSYLDVAIGCCE
jgi:hypothetical protein